MTYSRQMTPTAKLSLAIALITVGGLALACADAPTKPKALVVSAGSRQSVMAARDVATPLIDDASGRLAAAVEDAITRDKVRDVLTRLSTALDRGDDRAAREHIGQLQRIIDARAGASDAADLAALGLALDQIELQLNSAKPPDK